MNDFAYIKRIEIKIVDSFIILFVALILLVLVGGMLAIQAVNCLSSKCLQKLRNFIDICINHIFSSSLTEHNSYETHGHECSLGVEFAIESCVCVRTPRN